MAAKGHKVIEMRQEKNWNNLEIIVNEESIYVGKLNDLEFGGDGELDPIVVEIEKLVKNAY